MVPKEIFLTKGVGKGKEKLVSFEQALRHAGIAPYNLVRVSSIFPPKCKVVSKKVGTNKLKHGQVVFCVLSDCSTKEPNRQLVSSVGLALPADNMKYGYISEHHAFGQTDEVAGDYAEDLAAYMLATTLGVSVDEHVHYDERKDIWKMNKEIVRTTNITQSARADKTGLWTTVVAAAVMIF